ncbi:MAG: hypothetical protein SF172_15780 [Burkholderiales bacterium]|jgi:hypothetical protein|nr:hypothetical protein [Burkholderiales bacterium]
MSMPFRADEAAQAGYEEAVKYLVMRPRQADEAQRERSKEVLQDLVDELGPVVDRYPTWHPLVCHHDSRLAVSTPGEQCGYKGLDHTKYFVHGFITCPYGDGQDVIDSVKALPPSGAAYVSANRLDVQFYDSGTTPILVKCEWNETLPMDKMIPLSIALPLLLEKEVPCWKWAQVAETWDTMRTYFLGGPHGARSSLFVNQETGQAMKKVWEALIYSGMFGPIKV